MQLYPKYKVSASGYQIVADEAEEVALGEGWFDSQAELDASLTHKPSREELLEMADELGVKVDKRWSDEKIAQAIAEAGKDDAE
ncbi:hypothetical protein D3C81_1855170 [compost metagenome]